MQSCDKQMWSFWPFWEEMSKKDICLNIQFLCIVNAQYSNDLKSIAGTCTCSIYNVLYGNLWKSPRYFLWQVYSERYVDQMGIIGYFPATVVKETHTFVQDTVQIPTAVSIFVSFLEDNVFLFFIKWLPTFISFYLFRRWTSTVIKTWQTEGSPFFSSLAFSNSGK